MLLRTCGYVISVGLAILGATLAERTRPLLRTDGAASGGVREVGGVCVAIMGLVLLLMLRATAHTNPNSRLHE